MTYKLRDKLNNMNIADLKAMREICEERSKVDKVWKKREEFVNEILYAKISVIFNYDI